jgi:hypothetical protein
MCSQLASQFEQNAGLIIDIAERDQDGRMLLFRVNGHGRVLSD